MKPTLGKSVVYVAADGARAAVISRVVLTRVANFTVTSSRGPHVITWTRPAATSTDEADYDVFLTIFEHTAVAASVSQPLTAIPYDGSGSPAVGTWHWPPRS